MNKYYASVISDDGFESHFRDVFSPDKLERLFIIKGASGTGKSTLMRKAAHAAQKNGFAVDYILCSSDPLSLDGIIVDGRIGVVDGTAPHTMDTVCAGAFDELVDLGERRAEAAVADLEELVTSGFGDVE